MPKATGICRQDRFRTFPSYNPRNKLTEISHERDLWAAVLQLAVDESLLNVGDKLREFSEKLSKKCIPDFNVKCQEKERQLKTVKSTARRFILRDGSMFPVICRMLDIDHISARKNIVNQWA